MLDGRHTFGCDLRDSGRRCLEPSDRRHPPDSRRRTAPDGSESVHSRADRLSPACCESCGWRTTLGMRVRDDRRRLPSRDEGVNARQTMQPHDGRRSTGDADDRSRHTAPTPHAPSVCRSARCGRDAGGVHGRRPRPEHERLPRQAPPRTAAPTTTTTTSAPSPTPSVDPVIAKIPADARAERQSRRRRPSRVLLHRAQSGHSRTAIARSSTDSASTQLQYLRRLC